MELNAPLSFKARKADTNKPPGESSLIFFQLAPSISASLTPGILADFFVESFSSRFFGSVLFAVVELAEPTLRKSVFAYRMVDIRISNTIPLFGFPNED